MNHLFDAARGGGYLSNFRCTGNCHFWGTFDNLLWKYGYHFHNFLTFHGIMGVLFGGFYIIYGIMVQIFIRFAELWP